MKKSPNAAPSASTEAVLADNVLHERIAEKAYDLYQKRGQIHGHNLEDWLNAERMVLAELKARAEDEPAKSRGRVRRSKKK